MTRCMIASLVALALAVTVGLAEESVRQASTNEDSLEKPHKHHHHHGHHHHKKDHHHEDDKVSTKAAALDSKDKKAEASLPKVTAVDTTPAISSGAQLSSAKRRQLEDKMRRIEGELSSKESRTRGMMQQGSLEVNGPLPTDFNERFSKAACKAANCDQAEVKVLESKPVAGTNGVVELIFEAPKDVLSEIENQASDPESKLALGSLHSFLVEKDEVQAPSPATVEMLTDGAPPAPCPPNEIPDTKYTERGIDIDTAMPYGDLEPFGREDTAQELTESSIKESDEMVDQLERAEVAEEKRAVFRALTRLRGAAITSFDGVARSQTGNIDEYNKVHKWRSTHPLHHLADEESDITKWAFPDNADF